MRLVSLRARSPGSQPVLLHPRLTVVVAAGESDRDAIGSVFGALVGRGIPVLEAIADVDGLTVPVDAAFAETFSTRGAPDPVVGVPLDSDLSLPAGANPQGARLAALRTEHRAVAGELALVERALRAERSSGDVMAPPELDRRRRRLEDLSTPPDALPGALPGTPAGALPGAPAPQVATLVAALRAALAEGGVTDSHELAERLEAVAERRSTDRTREQALDQLMSESQAAVEAARAAVARELSSELDPARVAELEQVREEMVGIVARPGVPGRRDRRRLEELRAAEARMLAELGHATYASIVGRTGQGAADSAVRAQVEARIELLGQLQDFWELQRRRMDDDRREEALLMAEAARLLGEPADAGRTRSPRLVAARLRESPSQRLSADGPEVRRLVAELEVALGIDPRGRSAQDVLAVAEVSLRGHKADVGATAHAAEVREAERLLAEGAARAARVSELERMQEDLALRLQGIEARLSAVERGAALTGAGSVSGLSEPGVAGGVIGGWSLADELGRRRSGPAGGLPALILEPPTSAGGNALETVDPLSVVALSATTQLVWITERVEVAEAVARVGDMAEVVYA